MMPLSFARWLACFALQVPLCSVAVSSLPNYSMAGSFVCNQELGEDLPPNLYLRTYVCSICDKCECGEVQDEKHVLFFCKCAEVCELRMRYRDRFERMFKTLCVFAPSSSEFIPFLTCHHSITDFKINAFLNQDSYRLLKFVSDLDSIFDTG